MIQEHVYAETASVSDILDVTRAYNEACICTDSFRLWHLRCLSAVCETSYQGHWHLRSLGIENAESHDTYCVHLYVSLPGYSNFHPIQDMYHMTFGLVCIVYRLAMFVNISVLRSIYLHWPFPTLTPCLSVIGVRNMLPTEVTPTHAATVYFYTQDHSDLRQLPSLRHWPTPNMCQTQRLSIRYPALCWTCNRFFVVVATCSNGFRTGVTQIYTPC